MRIVMHMGTIRNVRRFGVECTITSTLCGRSQYLKSGDGDNCSSDNNLVTCKFCLKKIEAIRARGDGGEVAR
jgi:hypothetical protein